jgi:hypothetical protein
LLDLAYSGPGPQDSLKLPSGSFFIGANNLVMLPWVISFIKVINDD